MGYPYPNFCLCAFWEPYNTQLLKRRGLEVPQAEVSRLGMFKLCLGPCATP